MPAWRIRLSLLILAIVQYVHGHLHSQGWDHDSIPITPNTICGIAIDVHCKSLRDSTSSKTKNLGNKVKGLPDATMQCYKLF